MAQEPAGIQAPIAAGTASPAWDTSHLGNSHDPQRRVSHPVGKHQAPRTAITLGALRPGTQGTVVGKAAGIWALLVRTAVALFFCFHEAVSAAAGQHQEPGSRDVREARTAPFAEEGAQLAAAAGAEDARERMPTDGSRCPR